MSENNMTKSQAKRQARREENKKAQAQVKRTNLVMNLVIALIVVLVAAGIGSYIYYRMTTTQASDNFSEFVNEDGTIKNVNPTDYIEPLDYKNITVPAAEVEYTEEEMQAAIDSLLTSNKVANTDASRTAADGDTLNIDYVGKIDGEEFDGGSTDGLGTDLTLGSGTYIDDFEQQLIGTHPGDEVTLNVTFPEDYTLSDLQGKEAVFEVVVNSIYDLPEFDDAFVAANLSEKASTAEEYREYLKTTNEAANLNTYLTEYLSENSKANSLNEDHVKYLKGVAKQNQLSYYESYNQMYLTFTGQVAFNSFSEYTGMTNAQFEEYLDEEARKQAAADMTYQYIFTDAGLSLSDEDYEAVVTSLTQDVADSYGKPYVMQIALHEKVIAYLAENVTIQ